MTQRTERVASTIERAIREVLARGLNDPRAKGMITVTSVLVSEDLRSATVSISVYPHQHEKLTMHALQHAAAHIRREAGELVALSQMPRLLFKVDGSIRAQAEAMNAISKAVADIAAKQTQGPSPEQVSGDDGEARP